MKPSGTLLRSPVMKTSSNSAKSALGAASALLLLAAFPANAATFTWNGDGTTKATSVAGSWLGGVVPPDYSDVRFAGTSGTATFLGGQVFKAGNFEVASNGYIFSTSTASASYTIELDSFSGSGLASSVLGTGANNAQVLTLQVNGNTAYNGTIKYTGSGMAGVTRLIKSGTGTLDLSQATLLTGEIRVTGGAMRLSNASLSNTSLLASGVRFGQVTGSLSSGGLIEIVGNNVDTSSFVSKLTTSASLNAGQVALGGQGANTLVDLAGFGAINGNLVVAFGGVATPDDISWAATANGFQPVVFQLGTAASTHTVTLKNNIDLRVAGRTLRVGNGAAAIDADVEGAITMTTAGYEDRVLTKDGTGTLRLSGNNATAAGRLLVSEGRVLVDGTWASATNNTTYGISVAAGATLGGDGAITLSNANAKLLVAGTLQAGRGGADQSLTLDSHIEMQIDSVLAFTIGGASDSDVLVRAGGSWLFQADQLVRVTALEFTGQDYALITGLDNSFAGAYDLSSWRLAPGSNVEGSFRFESGTLYFAAVPEPTSFIFFSLASGLLLTLRLRGHRRHS